MNVRPSPIAGRWYLDDPRGLARSVDAWLAEAEAAGPAPAGELLAVLAPHAGHMYSGAVAAYAFQAARAHPVERVVVLSPSHFHADGALLTSGHDAYQTPLGSVPVDRTAVRALRAALAAELGWPERAALVEIQRDREHAVEIELPFLQRALPEGFQLLPVMLRDQSAQVARALGQALAQVLRGGAALVVASSDLSHFFPQVIAERLDAAILRHVNAFDPQGVLMEDDPPEARACGHGVIAAGLWAARALGANRARVVKHATSGDVNGDREQVVGYAAAWVWKAASDEDG